MEYVTYNADGALTGAFMQELHPEHEDCYIEVTSEQRANWTTYRANEARTGLELLPVVETPPAPLSRRITKLAFRNRFTTTEKVLIDLSSIDDPAADMAARQQAAAVRVSLADMAAANYIDLDRTDTRAGVLMLETAGILGADRALEILDAEIQADERVLG